MRINENDMHGENKMVRERVVRGRGGNYKQRTEIMNLWQAGRLEEVDSRRN